VGRYRTINKHLPKGVYSVVNRHGQEYFYYRYARGTKHAGPRVELGKDPTDPEFWRKLRDTKGAPPARGHMVGTDRRLAGAEFGSAAAHDPKRVRPLFEPA
jgi:hypothetical protein